MGKTLACALSAALSLPLLGQQVVFEGRWTITPTSVNAIQTFPTTPSYGYKLQDTSFGQNVCGPFFATPGGQTYTTGVACASGFRNWTIWNGATSLGNFSTVATTQVASVVARTLYDPSTGTFTPRISTSGMLANQGRSQITQLDINGPPGAVGAAFASASLLPEPVPFAGILIEVALPELVAFSFVLDANGHANVPSPPLPGFTYYMQSALFDLNGDLIATNTVTVQ